MGRVLFLMKLFIRFSSGNKEALSNLVDEDTTYQFNLKGKKSFYIVANTKGMKLFERTNPSPAATFLADKGTFYKIFSASFRKMKPSSTKNWR